MKQDLMIYTLQELFRYPPQEQEALVDGLLTPGLYILGGSPKVGKSWLALQLCLAVCAGTPFLGRATRQAEVLYLALEDGPQRLHRRARHLLDGSQNTAPTGLYLCRQALAIGQGLEEQIQAVLDAHPGIRLVIIDTLQKVRCLPHAGVTYGGDYQDMARLKAFADRNGICLLLIHHLRKMGDEDPMNRLSGTNGLTGAADGTLILAREQRQETQATLTATGRDIEDVEEQLDFCDCRWERADPMARLQADFILGPLQRVLRQDGGFTGTATELANRLGKEGTLCAPAQLSRYIQKQEAWLVKAGIQIETCRTSQRRTLCLRLADSCDGDDSCDGYDGASVAPSAPQHLSLPSPPSLAS